MLDEKGREGESAGKEGKEDLHSLRLISVSPRLYVFLAI